MSLGLPLIALGCSSQSLARSTDLEPTTACENNPSSGSTVVQARLPWWHTLQVAATWEAEAGLLEASLGKTHTFKKLFVLYA